MNCGDQAMGGPHWIVAKPSAPAIAMTPSRTARGRDGPDLLHNTGWSMVYLSL